MEAVGLWIAYWDVLAFCVQGWEIVIGRVEHMITFVNIFTLIFFLGISYIAHWDSVVFGVGRWHNLEGYADVADFALDWLMSPLFFYSVVDYFFRTAEQPA